MTGLLLGFDLTTPNKDSSRVRGQSLALLATKVHSFVTCFQRQVLLIHMCNCSLVFIHKMIGLKELRQFPLCTNVQSLRQHTLLVNHKNPACSVQM
jgi:hypothetical protein